MRPDLIAGFDPSYKNTGFAVVAIGGELITRGIITPSGGDDAARFASLFDDVQTLCIKYSLCRAVVEVPAAFSYERSTNDEGKGKNFAALQKLSQATAVILASLGKVEGMSVTTRYAHHWKRLQGKKNLSKREMVALARRRFPEIRTAQITDHEAEAALLALLSF